MPNLRDVDKAAVDATKENCLTCACGNLSRRKGKGARQAMFLMGLGGGGLCGGEGGVQREKRGGGGGGGGAGRSLLDIPRRTRPSSRLDSLASPLSRGAAGESAAPGDALTWRGGATCCSVWRSACIH